MGLLFAGIGLAVYIKNVVDLIFPVAIAALAAALIGAEARWFAGALLAALYRYLQGGHVRRYR